MLSEKAPLIPAVGFFFSLELLGVMRLTDGPLLLLVDGSISRFLYLSSGCSTKASCVWCPPSSRPVSAAPGWPANVFALQTLLLISDSLMWILERGQKTQLKTCWHELLNI